MFAPYNEFYESETLEFRTHGREYGRIIEFRIRFAQNDKERPLVGFENRVRARHPSSTLPGYLKSRDRSDGVYARLRLVSRLEVLGYRRIPIRIAEFF
jgi:hypothetical protein